MPDTQAGRTAFLQSMTAAGERLIEWARINIIEEMPRE